MLMDEKMDHGDILAQIKVPIYPDETAETLSKKIIPLSSKLLLDTIPLWIDKKIKPQKQDDTKATYCQLIEREDGHIFWDSDAEEIYNKFRAFISWPGIFTVWEKKNVICRIKMTTVSFQNNDPEKKYELGEVFEINRKIGVRASRGVVFIEEIQVEGKKPVGLREFINGHKDFIGSILK